MSEWKNSSNPGELTLEEFVKVVRGSKARIAHLKEKLEWTIHLIYAIPGPVYGEVIRGSNAHEDKLVVLLDKKDQIEKKIIFLFILFFDNRLIVFLPCCLLLRSFYGIFKLLF